MKKAQKDFSADLDLNAAAADARASAGLPVHMASALTREEREAIALTGLQQRFNTLRPKISVLDRMATEQGVDRIDSIERAAYLLFPHTVYKSYPLSLLERGQFDRLTRWLQGLTAYDLNGISLAGVESIDDWIVALNDRVGVQLVHTSGTTGKLSFLPRAKSDQDERLRILALSIRDWNGLGSGPDILSSPYPIIYPSYRRGSSAFHRTIDSMSRLVARDEANVLTLYDATFSADVASLAGRLRVAESRGEQGRLQISPALRARRDEALKFEQERSQLLDKFFKDAETRFKGCDVVILGVRPLIFEWAAAGLQKGLRKLFTSRSVMLTGGGSKGRSLPPNAAEMIGDFLGFDTPVEMYGMSEMTGLCRKCEHGNFHIPPYIVPYVLHEDTGELLPRAGRHTGRFGFVDLFPADHWGGFLTGDKVTLGGWDDPCSCGRTGPYIEPGIQRFSELQGDDDKITCAGAPAAHDKALEYLASMAN